MLFLSKSKNLRVYRKRGSIQFVNGQYEANEAEAEFLRGVPECWTDEVFEEAQTVEFDLSSLTVDKLKKYAEENGIELTARLKAEIIAEIESALK